MSRLIITATTQTRPPERHNSDRLVTTSELMSWGRIESLRELRKGDYDSVEVYVKSLDELYRILPFTLVGAIPSARSRRVHDDEGKERRFSRSSVILRDVPPVVFLDWPRDLFVMLVASVLIVVTIAATKLLARRLRREQRQRVSVRTAAEGLRVCYLATDPVLEGNHGGAAAHRDGVLSGLRKLGCVVKLASPYTIPSNGFGPQIQMPRVRFTRGPIGMPQLLAGYLSYWGGRKAIGRWKPELIYQRYSNMDFSGVLLSRKLQVPFVLEYNGSFSWMSRNWDSHEMRLGGLSDLVEQTNFDHANLIVVVSEAMADMVVELGVPRDKVLVNPNGVDGEEFRTERHLDDAKALRELLEIPDQHVVVCFIGTFGRWHGAEVLSRAVRLVVEQRPKTHFLFVGQGITYPEVVEQLRKDGVERYATLTGTVPRQEAPKYLSIADIYASPHVPNPDGTAFFGSPTKLFEYMAMGRAIVASDLDQIGDVLTHDDTALMVEPGNAERLAKAIVRLIDEPELRERLGRRAREEALASYTWERNVGRMFGGLRRVSEPAETEVAA